MSLSLARRKGHELPLGLRFLSNLLHSIDVVLILIDATFLHGGCWGVADRHSCHQVCRTVKCIVDVLNHLAAQTLRVNLGEVLAV